MYISSNGLWVRRVSQPSTLCAVTFLTWVEECAKETGAKLLREALLGAKANCPDLCRFWQKRKKKRPNIFIWNKMKAVPSGIEPPGRWFWSPGIGGKKSFCGLKEKKEERDRNREEGEKTHSKSLRREVAVAAARGGCERRRLARPWKAAIWFLIPLYFWRERHLSHPPFLSAHPSPSPSSTCQSHWSFAFWKRTSTGRNSPCPGPGSERGRRATRLPQGREAKVTGTGGAGRRGVWGRGLLLPSARRALAGWDTDPGAAVVATRVHTRRVPIPPAPRAPPAGPRSCGRRPTRDQAG